MNHALLQQYMAHLKVHITDAQYRMVHDGWHEVERKVPWNKLYFFEGGEGLIILNGVRYAPQPGDVLFIPEGTVQTLQITSPKRYVKYWCHFNAYVGTTPICDLLDFPILLPVTDKPHLTQLFSSMIQSFNSNDGFAPLRANSQLMEILYLYFTEIAANRVTINKEANATKINALLIYMQENIHQKQQIEDFAKVMNLHPNYLIRLFRSNFGTSPMDYFNHLKVEKAKEMLVISQDPINVIADKLGFSTPYYFSTVFKAHTSYTPKDYRKQVRIKKDKKTDERFNVSEFI